ncbi:MAG TPA: hypothetical protein ENK15_06750 [Thermopetrobacter sp.]|nr:hypothetical protein [Thermopetrobacter sp.]
MTRQPQTPPKAGDGDYARLEIETPFPAPWLKNFFADPERLLRLNPLITFKAVQRATPDRWRLTGRNEANGMDFDVTARIIRDDGGWRIRWDGWLKNETRLEITGHDPARLIIIDDYSATPLAERRRRTAEVDTSLTAWGHAVHRYLRNLRRFAWLPGWRWFMSGPWIAMKPAGRRITVLLFWLTVAEFVLFLMVFAIFYLEYGA